MGFDVYGERPKTKTGEYFRNNVWWWRPLWDYVGLVCEDLLTQEDIAEGYMNNGHWIRSKQAKGIAERLTQLLESGEVGRYTKKYQARLRKLPMQQCIHCHGTGKRNDEYVKGKCNGCNGRGMIKAWATMYPFAENNVREFVKFCEESGGFRIS